MKKTLLVALLCVVPVMVSALSVRVTFGDPAMPISGGTFTGEAFLSSATANPSGYAIMPRQEIEQQIADAIATPAASTGRVFRSSVNNHLYYYDGSAWNRLD